MSGRKMKLSVEGWLIFVEKYLKNETTIKCESKKINDTAVSGYSAN
ncbi:hypothetical protein A5888_002219 [Enterococcus sp. 9E7_DIV0242]|uniref:Transposase n=1 Tax=Candidatus Enterococcus clewellii TaxID=1834193 RepID=A0AAQ3Y0L2_9ENTE